MAKGPAKAAQAKKTPAKGSAKKSAPTGGIPVDQMGVIQAKEKRNKPLVDLTDMKPIIVRDPVHDLIRIECPFAKALIDTEPFQRLRRIKQLGLANMVYPGAEHTRFNHSLGVYHLAHEAMDAIDKNLKALGREPRFTDDACEGLGFYYRRLVGLAALLHDVGHGPFSHMFERVAKEILKQKAQDHEDWTVAIIQNHEKVSGILGEFNEWIGDYFTALNKKREEAEKRHHPIPNIFEDLTKIYQHFYQPDFVTDLISSQMDVDRFDYLMRDSRNAGCHYGDFDIRWIFRSLLVVDVDPKNLTEANDTGDEIQGDTGVRQVLAVQDEKGRNCVEEYILGRHYMYIHLYYHKTIVGAEALLQRILKRGVEALKNGELDGDYPVLRSLAQDENPPIQDYLRVDDHVVLGWVSSWARSVGCKDKLLENLSARLIQRDLFVKIFPPTDEDQYADARDAIRKGLTDAGFDPDYYFFTTKLSDTAHKDFLYYLSKNKEGGFTDIRIYDKKEDTVRNLSHVKRSVVVAGSDVLTHDEKGWYVPREFTDQARQIVSK